MPYACISWQLLHVWAKIRKIVTDIQCTDPGVKPSKPEPEDEARKFRSSGETERALTILGMYEAGILWKENSDGSFLWQDAKGTWLLLIKNLQLAKEKTASV